MSKNRANAVDATMGLEATKTDTLEVLLRRADDALNVCSEEADRILDALVFVDRADEDKVRFTGPMAALPKMHQHVDYLVELGYALQRIRSLLTDDKVSTKADR